MNRDPSKAREDLPCLQGVKRVRCNRRHMGAYPPCVISKAREDLPCLQGVKRVRCNRRHMGAYPPLCHFDRAQASGEIFGKILREFYTVCLATLTAYNPRAAGQRPVRLAAVPSRWLAQGDKKGTHMCHPEFVEGSLWKYRQNLNRDPCRRSTQDDTKRKLPFNNQTARGKMTLLPKRTLVVAVGCALALPLGAKLACALRSSSSQKSRALPCDFREPCFRIPSAQFGKSARAQFFNRGSP